MAYATADLTPLFKDGRRVAPGQTGEQRADRWLYATSVDTLATVRADGYFSDAVSKRIEVGDEIVVRASDGGALLKAAEYSGSSLVVFDATSAADRNWSLTSASTSGSTSVEPLAISLTMTGAGGVGGRSHFTLTTNVALGAWSNALKGEVVYGASGRTTGLGSAILAEMTLSAGTTAGTYALFEGELNLGSGASLGAKTSLMYFSINGDDKATFDTGGALLNIAGITAGDAKFFDNTVNISNVNEITAGLRVILAGSEYYLLMATKADADDA